MYDYIARVYAMTFTPGEVVTHTGTNKCGTVMRPKKSHPHYVRVHFGMDGAGLCHPDELKKINTHNLEASSNGGIEVTTKSDFETLLEAANEVVSQWLDEGQEYNDAMIGLHIACRKLDGLTPTQEERDDG